MWENTSQCEHSKTWTKKKDLPVTQLCSLFEAEHKWVIDTVTPPKVYISRVHQHVQDDETKKAEKVNMNINLYVH